MNQGRQRFLGLASPHRTVSLSIPQKAGVALRAVEFGRLPADRLIRWADIAIAAEQSPPQWLLDLSLLDSSRFADMLHLLHQNAERMASREVDVCILAHLFSTGQLSITDLFQRAFSACLIEYDAPKSEPFEHLADVLCAWDQMDFPDLSQGDWQRRVSEALVECQRACGELPKFLSGLYAA